MLYADPVPDEFTSGSFYEQRPYYLSPEKLEGDYAPVRFERELNVLRTWRSDGSVLDVGCSTGGFLHQLNTRFPGAYQGIGLDVAGPALDYAESRGVCVTRKPFLELDPGERRFDGVTFWAVMEHLADPGKFLSKAAQLLVPGGHCFILAPNMRSLAVRLLGLRYRYILPEHLNYFTPATFRAFAMREPAFEIADAGSTHFNPAVIWQDFQSGGREAPDQARAQLLQRTTAWKQNPLLRPARVFYSGIEKILGSMNMADNLYVVLRKKRMEAK